MTNKNSKFQKIFAISFLILLITAVLLPNPIQAAGLVPCGGTGEPTCQFCHFFVLLNNVMNFLFKLIPAIAALMLVFAGLKFFMAVENPGEAKNAQDMIKSVIIGLIIIYSAWAIVGAFLATIGLAEWTENIFKNWWTSGLFQINCPTP